MGKGDSFNRELRSAIVWCTVHFVQMLFLYICILSGCVCESGSANRNDAGPITHLQLPVEKVDSLQYYRKIQQLANNDEGGFWPVKNQPCPLKRAVLPKKRIVAYYGNLYSKRMGALGQYPPAEMWQRLHAEVRNWEQADSLTPVQPALHYIAVVAQHVPGNDGKYRLRMPDTQIDSVLSIADMGKAIVFLDIQLGHSTLREELPRLKHYLMMPQVHLAVDPEFALEQGYTPGHKIGSIDAEDINFCVEYLAQIVREQKLNPKILVVHRFTQKMVTNYDDIILCPEVQIVINMDGWGNPVLKYSSYRDFIYREPVQFTGFKLFYVNDLKKSPHRLITPRELMKLKPIPIYIQYQ